MIRTIATQRGELVLGDRPVAPGHRQDAVQLTIDDHRNPRTVPHPLLAGKLANRRPELGGIERTRRRDAFVRCPREQRVFVKRPGRARPAALRVELRLDGDDAVGDPAVVGAARPPARRRGDLGGHPHPGRHHEPRIERRVELARHVAEHLRLAQCLLALGDRGPEPAPQVVGAEDDDRPGDRPQAGTSDDDDRVRLPKRCHHEHDDDAGHEDERLGQPVVEGDPADREQDERLQAGGDAPLGLEQQGQRDDVAARREQLHPRGHVKPWEHEREHNDHGQDRAARKVGGRRLRS